MKRKLWILTLILLLSVFIIASCATTTPTSVWKDPEYQGQIGKVFVIGIAHKSRIRKFFEDEFVRQLKSNGIDAVVSYQVLPDIRRLDRENIRSKIKRLDIDTVLITRVVDRVKEERYDTTFIPTTREYDMYVYIAGTGATFEDERISLKTNIYNTSNERLIWSASSETYLMEYSDRYEETEKFIKVMMKIMRKDQLIK